MKINSFDEALGRIKELEKEVALLKAENEKLRGRNFGGRKKHGWLRIMILSLSLKKE